jgi:serine/threonine protein phosphatase PrpC
MEAVASSAIECGVAALALSGQRNCGDLWVIEWLPSRALIAVCDGIGHGDEAASAATTAAKILRDHADEAPVALVRRCHDGLRATRGVVMSLASFNLIDRSMTWLGVGNVTGVLLRRAQLPAGSEESLLLRAGVIGSHLPLLHEEVLPVSPGDTLIFATDGISSDFSRALAASLRPQKAAEAILEEHGKKNDDALVLVARYSGGCK